MTSFPMLPWLYDIKLDANGVRFVLFGFWTVHLLRFENIKSVIEIGNLSLGAWNAYNFKNRLFARALLIEMHRGWFARKVLVTPKNPNEFLVCLRDHGVVISTGRAH